MPGGAIDHAMNNGVLAGVALDRDYPELPDGLLVPVTELNQPETSSSCATCWSRRGAKNRWSFADGEWWKATTEAGEGRWRSTRVGTRPAPPRAARFEESSSGRRGIDQRDGAASERRAPRDPRSGALPRRRFPASPS